MPKKIIGNDYTIKFHESASIGYQPIVGNYSVSETQTSTGVSWQGSQGHSLGNFLQHDAFESAFKGRFITFMSKSSDWGFCNDKIVQAQGGDTRTSLISNFDDTVPIQRYARNLMSAQSNRNPIVGMENIFTKDGKLYTSLTTLSHGGHFGVVEYTKVTGEEGENDRWEISDYIPIGTGSFSTMDTQFQYTNTTGSTWDQYFAAPNYSTVENIVTNAQLVYDVCQFGEEKYLVVNVFGGIWVDRDDESKGIAYAGPETMHQGFSARKSIEHRASTNTGLSNWFFLIYRSGSTTGWRQETAITPKLLYDYCFAEDETGARINLRLNDQDPTYRQTDDIHAVHKTNAEQHWQGFQDMLKWYVRLDSDSSGNTFNPDNNISTLSSYGQNFELRGHWVNDRVRQFDGTVYNQPVNDYDYQKDYRALPWMNGWILDTGANVGMGRVKFCIADVAEGETPELRLACLAPMNNLNMVVHKSSSAGGWAVEDFVYCGNSFFPGTNQNTTQNWTYSPSRNEFYLNAQHEQGKSAFIQIISSASSGIYFEPDNVTWEFLNRPKGKDSSHVVVDVLDRNASGEAAKLTNHHTGSFKITDHEGNDMTIQISVDATLPSPTVVGQTITHLGDVGTHYTSTNQKTALRDYIVEAVNNGGPNGTADYFFTASLIRDKVVNQEVCVLIQSIASSSAANVSIDDSPVGLQPLSTDIRFSQALQNNNADASTFYPVGQASMVSGSRGPKLSMRGGWRPARNDNYAKAEINNNGSPLWYTGSRPNTAGKFLMNRYFTIDDNGEVIDYNERTYPYGVPDYLVEFGQSMHGASDRIDLWQLQRTGVLGQTTDGPEGSEWLTMWDNSNDFYVHDPDPATQYSRRGNYWSNTEAMWVRDFGRMIRIDSYGRLYTVGVGEKKIPGTGNVSAGNPEGHTLSLRDRVYILNSASIENHKTGSCGWYVEEVIYDPDYDVGGPLHGLNDFTYASRSADRDAGNNDERYYYSGFGGQIAVNQFAEDYTTQLFIASPQRVSDEITNIRRGDIDSDYWWAEPAGVGYLYQSKSDHFDWRLEQIFENPVAKFLSRPEEDITYLMNRYRSSFPQLGWRHFGGMHQPGSGPGEVFRAIRDEDETSKRDPGSQYAWYTTLRYPNLRHAFSGSVLALSWVDRSRPQDGHPFERGYDSTGHSQQVYPRSLDSFEEFNTHLTGAWPHGAIVVYDGNAEYITTRETTRTVNIVDGPVPTRVGNVRGAFNIRGQEGTGSYRVSIGDKKK